MRHTRPILEPVLVRPARIEDVDACVTVLAEVAREGLIATEPPVDVAERAAKAREAIDADGPDGLFVLDHEGQVVGVVGVASTGAPGVLSLGMMIRPSWRGRGGGRALLQAAVRHARMYGAHKLELEVWPDNERAIRLYKSAGFEVEGTRRSHYRRRDGSLRSALLMALLLSETEGP